MEGNHAGSEASTRHRIVVAAREEFRQNGIRRTSLDAVAHAAGVHRATLHRTFPGGRDELVTDVLIVAALEAFADAEPLLRKAPTVTEGLTELFTEVVMVGRGDAVVYEAIVTLAGSLALSDDRLEPLIAMGEQWWNDLVAVRADQEGLAMADAARTKRLVDHILRMLISLVREPGIVAGRTDVRAYVADFFIPVILPG